MVFTGERSDDDKAESGGGGEGGSCGYCCTLVGRLVRPHCRDFQPAIVRPGVRPPVCDGKWRRQECSERRAVQGRGSG